MQAMLQCSGEVGFEGASVRAVCRRAGVTPAEFGLRFTGKEECFALAYAEHGGRAWERLGMLLLAEGGSDALRHALSELAAAVGQFPAVARAMVLEVNHAGAHAAWERLELFERLARLVDCCLETGASGAPTPSTKAAFLVGAVSGTLSSALTSEDGDASSGEYGAHAGSLWDSLATYL